MTANNYAKLVRQVVIEESVKPVTKDIKPENIKPKKACEAYKVFVRKNNINFESYK